MKTALVLGGGGGKGSFQAGAEEYLREQGLHWSHVSGVSVGALNAAMIATGSSTKLKNLWEDIGASDVYQNPGWIRAAWNMLSRKSRGAWSNEPLLRTIQRHVDFTRLDRSLTFGVTDLESGDFLQFPVEPDDPVDAVQNDELQRLLLASTTIPLVWDPVSVGQYTALVDGGVRTGNPLGSVLRSDPDLVVVIVCSPIGKVEPQESPSNAFSVGKRTLSIMMNELFQDDVRSFLRLNRLVDQALAQGTQLTRSDGSPLKPYKSIIVEPNVDIGDALDFDNHAEKWKLGRAAAARAWAAYQAE